MTDTATDTGLVVRDLGDHGRVEFQDGEGRRRAYHLVAPDGKRTRLPSVTTVLGVLEKRALYRWHEAKGCEGTIRAIRAGELDPHECDIGEAIEVVRLLDLGADAEKKKAADRGLDVHGALEQWCRTGELPAAGELRIDARPYLRGLARWLLSADPLPVQVERIVAHPTLLYAGRYDLLAVVDGRLTLLDLKTSKSGLPYPEAHTQLQAYWQAELAVGVEGIELAQAVGVSPDGQFTVEDCCAEPDGFEQVLAVYRQRLALDRAIRAARKAAAAERA